MTLGHKARYGGSFLELEKERDLPQSLTEGHGSANSFWIPDLQNARVINVGHFESLDLQQFVTAAIGH